MNCPDLKNHRPDQSRAANPDRRGLSAALALLFVVTLANGCGQKQTAGAQGPGAVAVKTVIVQPVQIPDTSEYLATLKSRHSTLLNPQVEGQVTNIFVKSGDRVKTGTPLMQIDPLKQQATLNSQEAAHAAQKANVQFAQEQWERARKLYEAGVISKMEFDQVQTSLDSAREQLRSLEAQVNQQTVELHYYRVVAPTDGIVGDIPVRVGDRVTVSTLLTTVDEPGSLELYVNLPVERAKELKMGQPVHLLDTDGKVLAESRVDFISSEVDTNTQSILAKATFKNTSNTLRTAQFARARVIWGVHEGPVVPVLAVSRINGQIFVFVVERSGNSLVAHQRLLRVGELIGNQYAVLDGLKAGDRVVVEGTQSLVDGAAVTEAAPAPSGKPAT
jgi:RND family efflux transporter MFP subunit